MNTVAARLVAQTDNQELLERYQPGPVALGIVLLLGVAVFLLWLSLRRQITRIDFDEQATDDAGRMRRGPDVRPPPDA